MGRRSVYSAWRGNHFVQSIVVCVINVSLEVTTTVLGYGIVSDPTTTGNSSSSSSCWSSV